MQPDTWLHNVDNCQSEDERDRCYHLEVDNRFQPDSPHRLHAARAGDTADQRAEQQWGDNRLDQAQENVADR